MGKKIPVHKWLFQDGGKNVAANYSPESVRIFRERIKRRERNYYGATDSLLYEAMDRFPITGKSVLVYGSETPWYEIMALEFGAKSVTVVEYNDRDANIPNVRYVKPCDLGDEKFDCVFSISSFEHDGLGRYGDPLDPDGDIKAMADARRHIQDNGVMFLAMPVGHDALVWNAHRVYGSLRLPLLLQGWKMISSFGFSESDFSKGFDNVTSSSIHQPVFVLKKEGISVLIFSKDRPLFLDTHLETLAPTVSKGEIDVTVYFMTTSDGMAAAYGEVHQKYPWAKFICQNHKDELRPFLQSWSQDAEKYVLITVDDNVCGGVLDIETIRNTLEDENVFGFTLRLHPGIRHIQVDGEADDPGPLSNEKVVMYEPSKYGLPWNYVWEMSSTVFRREALQTVLCSGKSILSVNDLETVGLGVFPTSGVKKMACFNWAPVTNIFVDSWLSPQIVSNRVSNELAFEIYNNGEKIDVEETFRCRDRLATTHVKELF